MLYDVYAFGSNARGQLGVDHFEDISEPTRCVLETSSFDSRPIGLAAGGNHTHILCENGTVWGCGFRSSGDAQDDVSIARFQCLMIHEGEVTTRHFSFIAATWEASILVTVDARTVYTYGIGAKGELGRISEGDASSAASYSPPNRILGFPPDGIVVVSLNASMSHVVAVLSNGEAYGWGAGRKGQLGEPSEIVWKPRKIANVAFKVAKAVCGRTFTLLVGSDEKIQSKLIGSIKREGPAVSTGSKILDGICALRDVQAGWGNVYTLLQNGKLAVHGHDTHGQIPSAMLTEGITYIAAGSEHALAVTEGGDLLTWGWSEHGNCGPTNAGHKGSVNRYAKPNNTYILGAGCATSFLVMSRSHSEVRPSNHHLLLRAPIA
ncbi:MAG: hypothetical protein M1828_004370 [Chrysothrix sp. TS-e1954]|nr:MAG: hypothetical protein M1828_004370 [Chrysothrix sp. TS-e1954]